jgi:hypothetical protein
MGEMGLEAQGQSTKSRWDARGGPPRGRKPSESVNGKQRRAWEDIVKNDNRLECVMQKDRK